MASRLSVCKFYTEVLREGVKTVKWEGGEGLFILFVVFYN